MKKPQINDDKKKKWDNFWYYYKYHVLAGAFVLFCVIVFVKDMMAKVDYDYCISVIGNYPVQEEDTQVLQDWFEEHAEDLQWGWRGSCTDCRLFTARRGSRI